MNTNISIRALHEKAIRNLFQEKRFELSEKEWNALYRLGFDKASVANVVCKNVIRFEIQCYDRYLIIAWNDERLNKDEAEIILEEAYDEWVYGSDDADSYCCEEWILSQMDKTGIDYYYIYDE